MHQRSWRPCAADRAELAGGGAAAQEEELWSDQGPRNGADDRFGRVAAAEFAPTSVSWQVGLFAAETHLHVDTVRTWRGRFAHGELPALADRKHSGRPARFTPAQVAEAKALACQLPAETGVPLSLWSCPELTAELTAPH